MIAVPGTAFVIPSVFVMDRSPRGVTSSTSVAALFVRFVSVVPDAAVAVAVLVSVAVPAGVLATTVAVTVYVTVAPEGTSATVARLPLPEAVPQIPPPVPTHVQVVPVSAAGSVSVTETFEAVDGPAFVTAMV